MNFGMGLTRVRFRDYFSGTALGIIVGTFIFTFFVGRLRRLGKRLLESMVIWADNPLQNLLVRYKLNKDGLNVMEKGLTLIQRVAICFAAGVIGGLAVLLFGRVLFELGLSATFGVKAPISVEPAGYIQAALLGRAVGYPVRAFYRDRLEATVPLRSSILPRAGAGAVHNLPADEWRGVFRASAGRADVRSLPAAGKSAVRDSHRFGSNGDNREEAVIMNIIQPPLFSIA